VKDDYEIATLREAARRLSRVARRVADVGGGQTERQVARMIDAHLIDAGFNKPALIRLPPADPMPRCRTPILASEN
jgi:Xaa-Pro aminopeptidase